MKKNIWRKHPINRSTIHLPKMARKLHRICQTIRKKLIENYQTTDRELPNNLETLCKNKEGQNDDNNLNNSNKDRKPALARVRVEKSREDKIRAE